jgi:hypothetical protein
VEVERIRIADIPSPAFSDRFLKKLLRTSRRPAGRTLEVLDAPWGGLPAEHQVRALERAGAKFGDPSRGGQRMGVTASQVKRSEFRRP